MTSSYLRTVTSAFEAACRIPAIKFGRIDPLKDSNNNKMVTATWSQTSIAAGKKISFSTSFVVSEEGKSVSSSGFPSPLAENDLMASQGELSVQILKFKADKGEQEVLHVFKAGRLQETFNLTDLDLHGQVYFDDELGGIAINDDGSKIAYIAEAKVPKSTPFCKTSNGNNNKKELQEKGEVSSAEKETSGLIGQEFRFKEEFGEQMVGKSQPVIVTLDLKSGEDSKCKFDVVSADDFPQGWHPGQLTFFGRDNLIGIATKVSPRNLGLVYCSNRPCVVFSLVLTKEKNVFKALSAPASAETMTSARSPRVSPSGKLIWLERDLNQGGCFPGPHQAAFRLMRLDLVESSKKPSVLIDVLGSQMRSVGDNDDKKAWQFKGIYVVSLPRRCFTADEKFAIFSNVLEDTFFPVVVDLTSGVSYLQKQSSNNFVLDVYANDVVASFSTPLQSPIISFASLKTTTEDGITLAFQPLEMPGKSVLPDFVTETLWLKPEKSHPDPRFADVGFSAIYVGPSKGSPKSVPLIVWPHGGPQSVITTSFINEGYFFGLLGYAVVIVNYRGSIGAGEVALESLLGNIGDIDVKDCHQTRTECLARFPHLNPEGVVLFGGSHGGFLVLHLAAQYSDFYKAVVARNPVTNLATMSALTDIPDWNCVEIGVKYDYRSANPALAKKMFGCSPIAHVDKVKAPVQLMIGKIDLRVPPSQGYEYYHNLKALGKEVEMNVYDDNHPLSKIPVMINVMINSALFFERNLK